MDPNFKLNHLFDFSGYKPPPNFVSLAEPEPLKPQADVIKNVSETKEEIADAQPDQPGEDEKEGKKSKVIPEEKKEHVSVEPAVSETKQEESVNADAEKTGQIVSIGNEITPSDNEKKVEQADIGTYFLFLFIF